MPQRGGFGRRFPTFRQQRLGLVESEHVGESDRFDKVGKEAQFRIVGDDLRTQLPELLEKSQIIGRAPQVVVETQVGNVDQELLERGQSLHRRIVFQFDEPQQGRHLFHVHRFGV